MVIHDEWDSFVLHWIKNALMRDYNIESGKTLRDMKPSSQAFPRIGVVIVTYSAESYIAGCLESLIASNYPDLRIVVVDNASPDRTADAVRAWATGRRCFVPPADWPLPLRESAPGRLGFQEVVIDQVSPEACVADMTLALSSKNAGFAGGVNAGVRILLADPDVEAFWILNPDAIVEPQTPFALARKARSMGRFGVIGGRVLFLSEPTRIQADAGRLHSLAFTAISVNHGAVAAETPMPSEDAVDYVPGVSMLVSREFIERAGPMDERYFLYFEEIDWQLRRGDLPIGLEADARVLHSAGAAIGSGGWRRAASPFSIYFTCRNLLRFVTRWSPWRLPFAYAMVWVKLARHWGFGRREFGALIRGLHGLGPPAAVRARLPECVWRDILASHGIASARKAVGPEKDRAGLVAENPDIS